MDMQGFLFLVVAGAGIATWSVKRKRRPSAQKIISDYGSFIERHGPTPLRIEDVSALPYSKDAILSALLSAIIPGQHQQNNLLKTGALFLAQFQPGVGSDPLFQGGFDISEHFRHPSPSNSTEIMALAKGMASKSKKFNDQAERYNSYSALVEQDLALLMARFDAATKKP